jgi:hypothetical protein
MKDDCIIKKTFEEQELEILRNAIDLSQEKIGKKSVNSPEIKKMIRILEKFIRDKHVICYGGTAINNLLPESEQFYNKDIEIPDYDFFTPTPIDDAKELADIFYSHGYESVEAKAGQHYGTYKVFVDFIPIADITKLDIGLYKAVRAESIKLNGILYAPPNFLRMSMYVELSRPAGDISRWEKVLKRLILLNKHYPLRGKKCNSIDFVRSFESNIKDERHIYNIVKDTLINEGVVFFGGYACALYGTYMHEKKRKDYEVPDFDVLSVDPLKTAKRVKMSLEQEGFRKIKIIKHKAIGEIIMAHYQIEVDGETVAFIYEPIACHSYNTLMLHGQTIKIASIDTMLSFYLAFLYGDRPYYDKERILCMTEYLFTVQSKNRLEQKGLLKRFSTTCYGTQDTKESIRAEKALKYEELKSKKNSPEYEAYFLSYSPSQMNEIKHSSPSAYASPISLSSGTIATSRHMSRTPTTTRHASPSYKSNKTKRQNTTKPTSTRKHRKFSHRYIKF